MIISLTVLRRLALALLALACVGVAAAQQPGLKEKIDYKTIKPMPVATGDQIEVVEFFWYGCPHCNNLQAPLEAWLKRRPADVQFRRIPAVFRDSWLAHARLYYTLESLGELDRLHQAVYHAIHKNNESLANANSAADWAARNGIQPTRFLGAYNSPDMDRKVEQSKEATRAYALEGTPSLVVDGRYLTSSGMAESMPGVISNLEGLIVMARERRVGK